MAEILIGVPLKYLESLEAADLRLTESEWRSIIMQEIEDLQGQCEDLSEVDVDDVIDLLFNDGYVLQEVG